MIDRVLNRQVGELEGVIVLWQRLCAMIRSSRKDRPGDMDAVSGLRGELARRCPPLMESLEVAPEEWAESAQLLGNLGSHDFRGECTDLRWKMMEESMGRGEIVLQGMLGMLQARQRQLAGLSALACAGRRILGSWPCRLLYVVMGVVIIFLVLRIVLR
ncbi:MAG: hypothetical protein NT045_07240 [Candidatus Aureabacteria bacterium]|nr:hypothetical protein [Candidatus Auribacterota bacterium]